MKEVPVFIPPRKLKIGDLALGAEFRLSNGNECTVSRLSRVIRPGTHSGVEAICEPLGKPRIFHPTFEVWFLGTYSHNYLYNDED